MFLFISVCSVDNNSVIAATPSAGQDILTPMLASLDLSTPAPSVKPTVNYVSLSLLEYKDYLKPN